LIFILLFALISNTRSLIYFFNRRKNFAFDGLVTYTLEFTKKDDLIFGKPITTNYVSFVTDRRIVNNYFDSDLKHLNHEGRGKVIKEVKKTKPKNYDIKK
jgi:hypothetical protein